MVTLLLPVKTNFDRKFYFSYFFKTFEERFVFRSPELCSEVLSLKDNLIMLCVVTL